MSALKEIRIMLVGDFLIFRNGLKLLLETEKNIKVIGEANDLPEASKLIPKVKPDILLVDDGKTNNDSFTTFVSLQPTSTPIIVLTNSKEMEIHRKYLMLGINGVVTKEQNVNVLYKAIDKVNKGEFWFVRKLIDETIKQLVNERNSAPNNLYSYNCASLTVREREVLSHICKGMKNKAIAEKLFITETTVRHHLTSIFEKLNVNSRLELVVHAFRQKLVEIPVESKETFSNQVVF
jgi:DNA-binding NarL/FixJ family response regulator